jgi:hypothetical protein
VKVKAKVKAKEKARAKAKVTPRAKVMAEAMANIFYKNKITNFVFHYFTKENKVVFNP